MFRYVATILVGIVLPAPLVAGITPFPASNVTGGIVPNSGHWIMEENPQATIKLVTDFLAK